MQVANVNLPITVTGRHVSVTDAMREYAQKKVEGLHLDYPRIIEAKVLLDVEGYRHIAEIVLHCANHITIEADTETSDMYASIDETISKIARRMRKYKTRMLKSHRPKRGQTKMLAEKVFSQTLPEDEHQEVEPLIIHKENYAIRDLFTDEAIMDLELSERNFVVYHDANTHQLCILYRRKDGDYGVIEPSAHHA